MQLRIIQTTQQSWDSKRHNNLSGDKLKFSENATKHYGQPIKTKIQYNIAWWWNKLGTGSQVMFKSQIRIRHKPVLSSLVMWNCNGIHTESMARYNTFNTESMVRCNKNQCGCPSSHHDERRVGLQCGTWHVLRHIDSQFSNVHLKANKLPPCSSMDSWEQQICCIRITLQSKRGIVWSSE